MMSGRPFLADQLAKLTHPRRLLRKNTKVFPALYNQWYVVPWHHSTRQTRTVPSPAPEASWLPSGDQLTLLTILV